jgi:hypothetical protein
MYGCSGTGQTRLPPRVHAFVIHRYSLEGIAMFARLPAFDEAAGRPLSGLNVFQCFGDLPLQAAFIGKVREMPQKLQ